MSLHEYTRSIDAIAADYPFYALIMAAMRQADTDNLERLKRAWPQVWAELEARYWAAGGILADD